MRPVTLPKPLLAVVAVALIDHEHRILVQQRPPGTSMAGMWEFPGGKIEPGEHPEQALARELFEELGIVVSESDLHCGPFVSEPLGDRHLLLLLFLCRRWAGEPVALHATELAWHPISALHSVSMPPADLPLIEGLARFMGPSRSA